MKQKLMPLLLVLLLLALAACTAVQGGEPAASDGAPVAGEPDPNAPVSSDDPTAEPKPGDTADGEMVIGKANVESISINIMESFPVQVSVDVIGYLSDGCTELGEFTTERVEDTFLVTIPTQRPADAMCTQEIVDFEQSVALDVVGLPAGTYTVDVNGVTDTFTLDVDNTLPGAEPADAGDPGVELPQEDVADLIRLSLERALVAQEIPDYALLADQEQIVLSTENIDAALVPELDGVALVTMTPEEIQARADAEGDFPYLRFEEIRAATADSARVSLGSTWARAADSEILYLSGGGFTIDYTRTADGWSGEVTQSWIS